MASAAAALALFVSTGIAVAETPLMVGGDEAGPVDAAVVDGVEGSYVQATTALRDDDGNVLDPIPDIVEFSSPHGDLLVPEATTSDATGSYGFVGLPASTSGESFVGASLFSAFSIRLVGRELVPPIVEDGLVTYLDALGDGTSVEATLEAGAIEEWIVVPDLESLRPYEYVIEAPTGGVEIDQVDETSLVVRSGEATLLVAAPEAIDHDGASFTPRLEATETGFVLTVPDAESAVFPLRIDPQFATGDSGAGLNAFTGTFCGPLSTDATDFSNYDEVEQVVRSCDTSNASGVLTSSVTGNFEWLWANSTGIGIRAAGSSVPANRSSYFEFHAPPQAGIFSANLRGHVPDVSGDITCEMTYDPGVPRSIISPVFHDPGTATGTGNAPRNGSDNRLWAGKPRGADADPAWSTFPLPQGYKNMINGENGKKHMRGFWAIEPNPNSVPIGQLASYIRLTMYTDTAITVAAKHRCMIDGVAIIAFTDGEDPTLRVGGDIRSDFERSDLGPLQLAQWHRPSDADAADFSAPIRNAKFIDRQSGMRSADLRIGDVPGEGSARPDGVLRTCTGLDAGGDSGTLGGAADRWQSTDGFDRVGPCPRTINMPTSGDVFSTPTNRRAGRHALHSTLEDFAHRTTVVSAKPANPVGGPAEAQSGWYWIDAHEPSCSSLSATGSLSDATIQLTAVDPGFDQSGGAFLLPNRAEAYRLGSGMAQARVFVNGQLVETFTPSSGAELSRTLSNINLRANQTIENRRRIATIVVELTDRTSTPWVRNSGGAAPGLITLPNPPHSRYTVPYPNTVSVTTGAGSAPTGNQCAIKLDMGPQEVHAPSCTPMPFQTGGSPTWSTPTQPIEPHAIQFLDGENGVYDGKGTVRVFAQDPEWLDNPSGGSGIGSIQLHITGAAPIVHLLSDLERDQGFVDFPSIDVASIAGLPDGTSFEHFVSRLWPTMTMTATVTDRSLDVDAGSDKTAVCVRPFDWRVKTDPPSCTEGPIQNEPLPITGASAIHIVDPDEDGVANVVVDFDAAPAGAATVRLTVNGNVISTASPAIGDTSVTFIDVDLLAGIVPASGTMTSFYSRAAHIDLEALVTDRTVIVPPQTQAEHQVACTRRIDLRLDETQPSCVDTPGNSPEPLPIHILDQDEDGYATIRVYFEDQGSLTDPPTGAGVGIVRLSMNDQAWKVRAVTNVERVQGYVDYEDVDVFEGLAQADNGGASIVVGGETFFPAATTVRIKAQLDDRTVLFEPEHIAEHQNECDIEQTFDAPPAPEVDAVRGADEIQGAWAQVPNARGYIWRCRRDNPLTELMPLTWFSSSDSDRIEDVPMGQVNGGVAIPPGEYASTGACAFSPDIGTNRGLRVFARSERFRVLSVERNDTETVDMRASYNTQREPEVTIDGHVWNSYLWMSENGVERDFQTTRDALPVLVRDPDGRNDLFGPSDPDERILHSELTRPTDPLPGAGDFGRIVVSVHDSLPGAQHIAEQRAWIVIGLNSDESAITYTLFEGLSPTDQAIRTLDVADADTCVAGGDSSNVAKGSYWVLRCDLIPAWDTVSLGVTWERVLLPVHPREYDEYPLEAGESAPAQGVHNVDKPTPDRWDWKVSANVRDRRQAADDEYLALVPFGSAPNTPMPALAPNVSGADPLVIDRVLPTIVANTQQVPNQQQVPVAITVTDPKPDATSDPTAENASGLRDVYVRITSNASGSVIDERVLAYDECTPRFPLPENTTGNDRHSTSDCTPILIAPTEIGIYTVHARVRDMATNHAERDIELVIPEAAAPTAVRGAGGVAAWWPAVYGGTSYAYTCRVDGVTGPEQLAVLDSSGSWRTHLCVAGPGKRVDITVTSINSIGLRGPATGSAFAHVDQRPQIRLATSELPTRLPQALSNWESTRNGRVFANGERTPDTIVDVTDLDGNLLTQLAPDSHLFDLVERPACLVCDNDHARAVVTFRPDLAGTQPGSDARDVPDAAHLLIRLSADPAEQLVRIWDGPRDAAAWDRTLSAADADTCAPGEAGRVIHSQPSGMWTLNCERINFTQIANGMRVVMPVTPRDLGEGATPRFPTPDQAYKMQGVVKDQRQEADHRFLTNETDSGPDADPLADDLKVPREVWLWLDRVLPDLLTHEITATGTPNARKHHIWLRAIDPSGPTTDPAEVHQSGLFNVHVKGGRVNPSTGVVMNEVIDSDVTCQPGPTPVYTLLATCAIDTANLPGTGLYRYTVTLLDFLENHSEFTIEQQYYAPPGTPLLGSQTAARGGAIIWQEVPDATSYTWECRLGSASGAVIGSGNATAVQPAGTWRTDLCHAAPGSIIHTTVTAVGPGGAGVPATTLRRVDDRPSIDAAVDPDGSTARVDSYNGTVYANGTTSRDLLVRASDPNLSINQPRPPAIQWEGIPERPAIVPLPDANARSVISVLPPQGRPTDTAAYVIVQHGDPGVRLVKIVDEAFAEDLANTPILAGDHMFDPATCEPGQFKQIATAFWTVDCADLDYTVEDSTRALVRLPIRPTSTTPDQTYAVRGWVRESRQEVDYRYLSSDALSTFDQLYAGAATTSLGTFVVDRVLPEGTPNVPATTSGPVTIALDDAHDVTPSAATMPTTFDATGLARVTITVTNPDGSTLVAETNMTCSPSLPRTASDESDCTFQVNPTSGGEHTVTIRVEDVAENHVEYVRTFTYATVPPPNAPANVITSTGARGVGAWWAPVSGATGYVWECRRQADNTLVASGTAVPAGVAPNWRTSLCAGAPAEFLVFSVRSVGPGGASPTPATATGRVDVRPEIQSDADPDGSTMRYDTLNGSVYGNGTRDRSIRFRVTDTGTDLQTPPGSSPLFDGIPERPSPLKFIDATARSVVAVRPPAGRPLDTTAYLVVQYNGTNTGNVRRAALLDSSFAGDLATFDVDSVPNCNLTTGAPGLLQTDYWTLNCADIGYALASGADIRVSLPLRPKAATPDQTYAVSGWVRDQRQHLDNRYLSSDTSSSYDQPYQGAATASLGSIVVDRITPDGELSAAEQPGNDYQINVANARDIVPGAATSPTTFDATGLATATVTVTAPSGATIAQDESLTCSPALPRSGGQSSSCSITVSPTEGGVHTVRVTLTDIVGNHRELDGMFIADLTVPPIAAPTVSLVRGARGVVAKWPVLADATSYRWRCENLTRSTVQDGTATFASGTLVHTPVCDGNAGANFAGTNVRVTVWPVNSAGEGPSSTPATLTIDARPTVSTGVAAGFDPSPPWGSWGYSSSGTVYDNGTRNRDMYFRVQDADTDLIAASNPDPDLTAVQDPGAADDRARFILHVTPSLSGGVHATSTYVVVQLGADDGQRIARLTDDPISASAELDTLNPSDADTCVVGSAKQLVSNHWTLNCARLLIVRPGATLTALDMRIPLHPRVATDGTHLLPDDTYRAYGYVRDIRQPADNRFLTQNAATTNTSYGSVPPTLTFSSVYVDRLDPNATITSVVSTGSNGSRRITVNASANTTNPGPTTNPTSVKGTGVDSGKVTIDRMENGVAVESIVTGGSASCGSIMPAVTCTYTSPIVPPDATYRVTITVTDQARNFGVSAPESVTLPPETGSPGFLNPNFGTAGIALTEVGPNGGDANDSVLLPNGNVASVGTLGGTAAGDRQVVITSHTPTGQLAAGFGSGGIATALPSGMVRMDGNSITTDDAGRILVAGNSFFANGSSRLTIARFSSSGQLDTTYGTSGFSMFIVPPVPTRMIPTSITVDSSDRIVLGGYDLNGNSLAIARFLGDGSPDTSFGGDGYATFTPGGQMEQIGGSLAIQSDDKLLIGGNRIVSGTRVPSVARVLTDGSIDTTYGASGWYLGQPDGQQGSIRRVVLGPDDTALLALHCGGGCGLGIARLTSDGVLDTTFGSGDDGATYAPATGTARSYELVPTADGLYVVVGQADSQGNSGDEIAISRFDEEGLTDTDFGTNGTTITSSPNAVITTVSAVQVATGDIVVSGTSTPTTGNHRFLLAAYIT